MASFEIVEPETIDEAFAFLDSDDPAVRLDLGAPHELGERLAAVRGRTDARGRHGIHVLTTPLRIVAEVDTHG